MRTLLAVLLLSGVASIACQDSLVPVSVENESRLTFSNNGQRVSGHINLPVFDFPGLSIRERYSFNAIRHPDGSVTGEWQLDDKILPLGEFPFHGDVTCFTILPDNRTVWLGGTVERDRAFGGVGSDANWTVVDNGEGANAPADQATDLTTGFPPGAAANHCATGTGLTNIPLVDIVGGNVQVRP